MPQDEILAERAFVKDKIFDCLKMIGAASGSGFLAALIALPTSGKAACLIKTIASMLGVSVLLFCLAVFCYLRWLVGVQNARMDAQSTAQTTTLDEAQNEFAKKVLREPEPIRAIAHPH